MGSRRSQFRVMPSAVAMRSLTIFVKRYKQVTRTPQTRIIWLFAFRNLSNMLLSIFTAPISLSCLFALPLVVSSFISPNPRSDCSQGIGLGYVSCPNQPGCCFGGSVCCAGGCCPTGSFCVNFGLPNEGCCPFTDPTSCGVPKPTTVSFQCSLPVLDPWEIPLGLPILKLGVSDGRYLSLSLTYQQSYFPQGYGACGSQYKRWCSANSRDWQCPMDTICGSFSGSCLDFDDSTECTTTSAAGQASSTAGTASARSGSVVESAASSPTGSARPNDGGKIINRLPLPGWLAAMFLGWLV